MFPITAPALHHRFQQRSIVIITGHIVLPLIPDGTTHGVADEGFQLTIIQCGGTSLLQFLHIILRDGLLNLGEGFQPFWCHPCLTGRATPGSDDKSYGNIQGSTQRLSEIIGGGREVTHTGTMGLAPIACHIPLWCQRSMALDGKKSQVRILAVQEFLCRSLHGLLFESFHLHLHVRLS